MEHNQSFVWEFKLQMIPLLEKNAQNQIAHLEWLCGQQTLERRSPEIGGGRTKKCVRSAPVCAVTRARRRGYGSRCQSGPYVACVACWESNGHGPTSPLLLSSQERDQRLRTAIEGGREDLAGYAYRRVTKALVRFGGPGQLQTSLARHATS